MSTPRPDSPFGGPRRPRPQPVRLASQSLCRIDSPAPGRSLPLRMTATVEGLDAAVWLKNNRAMISDCLRQHGAIFFRGFGMKSPEQFERTILGLSGELLDYTYRSTPRTRVSGRVFTSTEYPADRSIPLHNEMSYSRSWPMKLWFCCLKTAMRGGETPIADSRRVLQRISKKTRERFGERGVMYVRNYGQGVDLPWEEVFQTSDSAEVERLCKQAGIQFEWKGNDRLTTRQVCQGLAQHPETGESVWFNQAHLFHLSSLPEESRELLLETLGQEDLPRNACYGDGSAIEPECLREIRHAFAEETVSFPWEDGDVMLVDNMLAAHGRTAYEGERRILVGMTDLHGAGFQGIEL